MNLSLTLRLQDVKDQYVVGAICFEAPGKTSAADASCRRSGAVSAEAQRTFMTTNVGVIGPKATVFLRRRRCLV